jgi:hypothetical protein
MISSGDAKPFPPELSHVMDNMYWWGKMHSNQWYEQVVDCMGVLLDNDTNEEVDEQQSKVVRYLIAFQVKTMIHEPFDIPSVPFTVAFDQWWHKFNCTYKKKDFQVGGSYTFREMAESSFEYVGWLHNEVEADVKAEEDMIVNVTPETVNS